MGLSACVLDPTPDPVPYDRPVAQSDDEISFAKSVLADAQVLSLKSGREYCGYIGLDAQGNLAATPPKRGRKSSCKPADVPEGFTEIASYHTHTTYSAANDSEWPSIEDVDAGLLEGTDGYLVTSSGRIWYIDGYALTARVTCGAGCLLADQNYVAEREPVTGKIYTITELEALLDGVG